MSQISSSQPVQRRSKSSTRVRRVPQTALCTIYNANLPRNERRRSPVGLTVFNDVILRLAFEWHLPVIELRLVCVDASDYATA